MTHTKDLGMITLKSDRWNFQVYYPIVTFKQDDMRLSFSTVLIARKNTWQFDWSIGFQVLGFGFAIGKLKENT